MARNNELYRHQCEVREVLKLRAQNGAHWVRVFLAEIAERRGQAVADRIRMDCTRAWARGERGDK